MKYSICRWLWLHYTNLIPFIVFISAMQSNRKADLNERCFQAVTINSNCMLLFVCFSMKTVLLLSVAHINFQPPMHAFIRCHVRFTVLFGIVNNAICMQILQIKIERNWTNNCGHRCFTGRNNYGERIARNGS